MLVPAVWRRFLGIVSQLTLLLLFSVPLVGVSAGQDPGTPCGTVAGDDEAVAATRAAADEMCPCD